MSMRLMAYFSHFGWSDCVNGVHQSFLVGGYSNTCLLCNQMEIQNLTVGLVECSEIFDFVNDSDNQTVRLWELSNQINETSLKSIKLGQSLVKFKVDSKTIGFDKIRLIKEVLSGFWVLASVLRFLWFSCLYLFRVLKCLSQKSNLTIGLK